MQTRDTIQRPQVIPAVRVSRLLLQITTGMLVLAAVALMLLAPPPGLSTETMRAGAVILFTLGCWSTGLLPTHIAGLAFFFLSIIWAIAPPAVVFSGFHTSAWWLVFSGLVLGAALKHTGLGERLAHRCVTWCGTSYISLISSLVVVGTALTFVMPSTMGRVLLLIPLVIALSERLGFTPGSPGRNGLIMATTLSTYMPAAAVLPAGVPNLVMAGAAENLYGITVTFAGYLLLHIPVTGVLKALAIVGVTLLVFPANAPYRALEIEQGPMQRKERWLLVLLAAALLLWVSDAVHAISPAWVALGAAVVCLLPGVQLVPSKAFQSQINFGPLFYMAAILGLGAVIADSGLGEILGAFFLERLPLEPGANSCNFIALVGTATTLGLVTTMPGVPAILSPLAMDIARATEWPVLTVLMTQVIGYSMVILPYQAPPLLLAMQLGGVPLAAGTRLLLVLTVVTLCFLTPLNFFWWQYLGYFAMPGQ